MQGDKNESRPAAKAAGKVTVSVNTKKILWLKLGFLIDSLWQINALFSRFQGISGKIRKTG
jgi:hypothetical protein